MLLKTQHPIVNSFFEAFNTHNTSRLLPFFAPNYTGQDISHPGFQQGTEQVKTLVEGYLRAFPDLTLEIKDTVIDRDHIAVYWAGHGTHLGPWLNIPPTGRRVTVEGMMMLTLKGEQIINGFSIWDVAGLLRSLGLLPEL